MSTAPTEDDLAGEEPTSGSRRTPPAEEIWRDGSLYRKLVEQCPDAVVVSDRDGTIRVWNRGAVRIFGYEEADVLGGSLDVIIPPSLRERHWSGYREVMASGHTSYADRLLKVPAQRRDGARISVEFNVALLRDGNGDLVGVAAYLRDVTAAWNEARKTRNRLRALEGELRAKGEDHE